MTIAQPLDSETAATGSFVAVIADIVGSRRHRDRHVTQQILDDAIDRVTADLDVAVQPFRPTVGDEQQAIYLTIPKALASLLLLRLVLPDAVDCRFGVGIGGTSRVPTRGGTIPDGPAWWSARQAIDTAHELQRHRAPGARTWVVAHESESVEVRDSTRAYNAYLLSRDQQVSLMSERTRRLVHGRCVGRTQAELAASEGITQPGVSQALSSSGAGSIIEGFRLLGLS